MLPTSLDAVAGVVPVTHAAELLRRPWLDGSWALGATLFVSSVLILSLVLVGWRLRRDDAA